MTTAFQRLRGGEAAGGKAADSVRPGAVSLRGLTRTYGDTTAVAGIDLEVPAGSFCTLLGPSGCGKTTTLMMLAGFVEPTAGGVLVDGHDIAHVPASERNIGVVFQNYALFPHMTVFDNLAFPLRMRRTRDAEVTARVEAVLELVQLGACAHRYPAELSGGQQQRVAVARAVVFNPPVLLMDEPLGALDRKLRLQLQREIRNLQRQLDLTVVYVTHDQDEAMSMSDQVAVLNRGRIEQAGTPAELYDTPATLFVADFLGDNNALTATVVDGDHVTLGRDTVVATVAHDLPPGAACTALIRPERVLIDDAEGPLRGTVLDVVYLGNASEYTLNVPGVGEVNSRLVHSGAHRVWARGDQVRVRLPAASVRVMPQD
ncbi:ABC transporter ATP-binding protein [Streptomyces sp. NPDC004629]|uniref:ABC transporter ATP-binding protein n=1 Tax=Streptomyces sp. NPDC004629 TaxID=3364705 RepID=UPI0036AB080E